MRIVFVFRGSKQPNSDLVVYKQRVVTKYGEISNWDVSNVEDMRYMFNSASSFNQPLTMMLSRMIQNEMQSA